VLDVGPPGDDEFVPPGGDQQQQQQHIPPPYQFFQQHQQMFQHWWMVPPPPAPQPQAQQQAEPHKVKLTAFWTHNPQIWFSHAEALFGTYRVMEERAKFNLVLPTLSEETLIRVAAIVTAPHLLAAPYTALRARLLEVYMPDVWDLTTRLLHYRELGDMLPSQLMDEMLAILPEGEVPGLLFKTIFLNRLPADVRAHVQRAARLQPCRELAAAADEIWRARNQPKPAKVAALPPVQADDLVETVAAMALGNGKTGGNNSSRGPRRGGSGRGRGRGSGGRQSGQKVAYLCFRHAKFGDAAWECEDPGRCSSATNVAGN